MIIECSFHFDLWKQMGGPFNWPGYQQGEKAYEDRIISEISLRLYTIIVNINYVGQSMKSVKRNTYRQYDI